ncbi:MAG: hypothetical protein HQL42_09675 [Alphaproteobacteria bacterium]|nr:hypothetical protein [Alphaproteobacteria bacterium]
MGQDDQQDAHDSGQQERQQDRFAEDLDNGRLIDRHFGEGQQDQDQVIDAVAEIDRHWTAHVVGLVAPGVGRLVESILGLLMLGRPVALQPA